MMPAIRHTATRDVITVLTRGWKVVLGVPVAFGLIALLWCSLQKPVYEATATLYITSGAVNANGQGQSLPYEFVLGAAGRVTSYAKLAYSDEVLERAVKDAGLNMTVAEARRIARSGMVPESEMLTVSARDPDPELAKRFASALAKSMVETVAKIEVPNGGGPPTSRLTLVTPSTLNPDPVSPATLMDVTLAAIGGLLLGVAAVLTRERLNNTVRDERDIEKVVGARPLARIPHDKTLGTALTIDFGTRGSASAAAFRHLRNALSVAHSKRSVTTFLVTSPRQGDGKSTVAINLAVAFAESGSTVVLVDADLGNPAAARRIGNGEAPGLADAIRSGVPPLQMSARTIEGLKVISAGRLGDSDAAGLLASSACGKFFKELTGSFDYVIVDSPSLLDGPEAEAAASWADGVLLVARRGRSKLSDCHTSVIQLADIGAELVGAVLNDVRPPKADARTAPPRAVRRRGDPIEVPTRSTTSNGRPKPTSKLPAAKGQDRKD
jgi:capsular exopolysaccharide synthesis family protein